MVLTMVSPTLGEISLRSEKRWVITIVLYVCITLVLLGVFLLGLAIMEKCKGAGVMAATLPSMFVCCAIATATFLNYIGEDMGEEEKVEWKSS
jgi:presenilin-like A22 family membrane protease